MTDSDDATERLKPYLPRLAVDWLVDSPEARHRRVPGTLAFVDISGFTKMTERLARKGKVGSEEVNDVLDLCFTRLLDVAYDDGGGVLKWGGDAVLLLFDGPEHAARAARAAFGMRRTLRQFGRLQTSAGLISLRMSVGIHSGEFDFFHVGESHRELIVAGPAATQTVAMEQIATAGEIALSAATASLLPIDAVGRAKGEARLLKGEPRTRRVLAQPVRETSGVDLASGIPTLLRTHLLSGGGDTEHRRVTVAFVQFQGVDVLIATRGAEAAAAALHELVSTAQRAADEHDVAFLATDVDRDGGKIILVAGAPVASGNDEERMLRAARSIADAGGELSLRIGVNSGPVVAGDFGPPYRRTYTIIGDGVNLAARIMGKAEPGTILATEDVLSRSRTVFDAVPLPAFLVKGKRLPVQAFQVGHIAGPRSTPPPAPLELVGRDAELRVLLDAFERAGGSRGALVEVVGEAGLGKSRLLQELRDHVGTALAISEGCDPYSTTSPYRTFRDPIRRLLGIDPDADASTGGEALLERLRSRHPGLLPWAPLLAVVTDVAVPSTPDVDRLETEFKSAKIAEVVVQLLDATLPRPAVLMFEDVHWMDEASRDLLGRIARGLETRAWMLCVSRRDESSGFVAPETPHTRTIALEPLDAADAAALVARVAKEHALPTHVIDSLTERAGGNPLFLQELVSAAREGRDLDALPETVEGLIAAQIDRLGAADRSLLRRAAVLGAVFDRELLDLTLDDGSPSRQPTPWERLSEFLHLEPSGTVRFRHALIRDAAYEGLPFRLRREMHARVGSVLEERADDPTEHAEILCFHFYAAAQWDRAWRYGRAAGERARSKFANIDAARFLRRALDAARRLDDVPASETAEVLEALGDVSERAGLYTQASAAYRDARRIVGDDTARGRLLLKEGLIRERAGRYPDALAWYGKALRALEPGADRAQARATRAQVKVWYASSRHEQGRYRDSVRWARQAIEDARAAGEKETLARGYRILGRALATLGHPDADHFRRLSLETYEQVGDLSGQSEALNDLGISAYFQGRWDEALELYRRSSDTRAKTGDEVNTAHGINNIAEILSDQGRLEEAEELFRDVLRVWTAAGFTLGVAFARSNLARVASRAGRHDEAAALYDEALAAFAAKRADAQALETRARIAENELLAGRIDQAMATARDVLARVEAEGGQDVLKAMSLRQLGWAHMLTGDFDGAQRSLQASLRSARAAGADFEIALTLRANARLAAMQDQAWGHELAAEAAGILERLGVREVAEPAVVLSATEPAVVLPASEPAASAERQA